MSAFISLLHRIETRTVPNYILPRFRVQAGEEGPDVQRISYPLLLNRILARSPQTWFVEGVAGSGKTSLTRRLAIDCVKNNLPCVFINRVSLHQGFRTDGDVRDFAKDSRPAEIDAALWKSHVRHYKCVLIVDAVNELQREFLGKTQWNFVRRVLESGHGYPVLATSRYEYEGNETLFRQWNALTLAPLDEDEISGYLIARGLDVPRALTEIEVAGLNGATWNPYLLSLLADLLIHQLATGVLTLPRSRAELLLATVNHSRRLTEAEKALSERGLHLGTVLCASSLTAFLSGKQSGTNLQFNDLVAMLERVWNVEGGITQLANAFLDTQMVEKTGLEDSAPSYQLLHPSLVDFGLALGWRNRTPGIMVRDPAYLDQFLGDWVGLQKDPDLAVRNLLRSDGAFLSPYILVDILLANRGVFCDETQGLLWQAIGDAFTGPRAVRDDLAQALGKLPKHIIHEGISHGLVRKLRRKHPSLADEIQEAFRNGSLTSHSYQRLLRRHQRIDHTEVRTGLAIRQDVQPSELERRLEHLLSGTDPDLRRSSANWMATYGIREAQSGLLSALEKETDCRTKGAIATALGQIGDRAAVEALAAALNDQTARADIRGSAATALGRIGDRAAVEALAAALNDQKARADIRGSAATALGQIGDRAAVEALAAALNDPSAEPKIRGSAATALGKIGDRAAVAVLSTSIKNESEDYWVRSSAVFAFAMLSSGERAWLMDVADDAIQRGRNEKPAKIFRGTIINILSHSISNDGERNWLDNVARHDPDPINRTAAVRGLSKAKQISEDLIRSVIDPGYFRRNGKLRDTDNGVCGEATAAIVRMVEYDSERALRLSKLFVSVLSRLDTWSSTQNAAFAPFLSLTDEAAQKLLNAIVEEISAVQETNQYFKRNVTRISERLAQRQRSAQEFKELSEKPEKMLMTFVNETTSQFKASNQAARDGGVDIGLLTAIPVETRAIVDELKRQGIPVNTIQKHGRYFDRFELAEGDRLVRVVFTQATDKGGQSANAAVHDMISEFHPGLIVLVGVAGGFSERKVKLFDLIVAKNIFNYDPERIQASHGGDRPQPYRTDEQFLRLVQHLETHGQLMDILSGNRLHQKDYASGEKVLAWRDAPIRKQLLDLSADIYGIETEGHGVMHAIWETFKADHFVGGTMIKCVSDLGDEDMGTDKDTKQQHASTKAARATLAVIRQFHRG